LVFEPGDAKGIARAIAHLLSNKKERERWRERALARAAEFSWHKAAERTIAVYRAVCDRVVVNKDLERQRVLADARDQQSA
jgi:glycosyltransferase involved in cell wall biosynthesis